ncbi:hypothetical protein TNCV_4231951 [Trichonephila clavipes]|nr:hypothetical protein TNCV_4231951 [Trichonephila clavipes]
MLENDGVNDENTVQNPKVSHIKGLKAVETSLQYFEQQAAPVMNSVFLRRLCNEDAKCGVQHGKQQDISHFFNRK